MVTPSFTAPLKPTLQLQLEARSAPADEVLALRGQAWQAEGEDETLNVPAAQGMHEGEFIPSLSCPASHHPDWKVSTAVLKGSPVPVTIRSVTQSEDSFSEEGEAKLLPWSLKSLGR